MGVVAQRPLPGVRFQTVSPPPRQVLPRMDITAFVGFAAAGPLDTPVSIQSVERFRDVFGGELPLAWDDEKGKMTYSYLLPAVDAFFRNGGRACRVVRVAGRDALEPATNLFQIPGLIDAATGRPAVARARSGGTWSDALRTGAVLRRELFEIARFENGDEDVRVEIQARPGAVAVGDVLRIAFEGGLLLWIVVNSTSRTAGGLEVRSGTFEWYSAENDLIAEPTKAVVRILGHDGTRLLPDATVRATRDGGYEVVFSSRFTDLPDRGDVLEIEVPAEKAARGSVRLWVAVSEVDLTSQNSVRAIAPEGLWRLPDVPDISDDLLFTAAERVNFDLLVWQGEDVTARLPELGMAAMPEGAAGRPFWADLPADDVLFGMRNGIEITREPGSLAAAVFEPRFPLAGPAARARLYVPLGMAEAPTPAAARGRLDDSRSDEAPLLRDGLADYGAHLFLDAALAGLSERTLLPKAHDLMYVLNRKLTGIHSLLPIDEVAVLAVPDTVHRGWERSRPHGSAMLAAPDPLEIHEEDEPGIYVAAWAASVLEWEGGDSMDEGATSPIYYELQRSDDAIFETRESLVVGETDDRFYSDSCCARRSFFRVRARRGAIVSPWSSTVAYVVPPQDFKDPEAAFLENTPELARIGSVLKWTEIEGADAFTLEVATDPGFSTARKIHNEVNVVDLDVENGAYRHEIEDARELIYFRVRAHRSGTPGPWSNTVYRVGSARRQWIVTPPADYVLSGGRDELLALQSAVLRFCRARADLTGVLTLPRHYGREESSAHVAMLTPDTSDDLDEITSDVLGGLSVPRMTMADEPALTFGAVYHPWLAFRIERARSEPVRFFPPDGAVCGMMARRALRRGAWVAPANVPLQGPVALDPAFDRSEWQDLLSRGINVVRSESNGFVLLSADTLHPLALLRPVNVRRLLILLRRLALREGNRHVFDSNDEILRRRMFILFKGLLDDLFERGAFAGRSPDEAYLLQLGDAVNTEASVDQGRLIVEIRIAPSKPLSFILVRLFQRDQGGITIEES